MEPTDHLEKPRETYRRLAALADDAAASDVERESARRIMARYIAKYGSELEIPEREIEISKDVKYANVYEDRLAVHCGMFAGCVLRVIGRRLYAGTKRERFRPDGKTLRYFGPESAVLSAVDLYEHHRPLLVELLETVENGYRFGAMPLKQQKTVAQKMDDRMAAALRAGRELGSSSRITKRLEGGR